MGHNEHLKKIFTDHEFLEDSVIRKFRITAKDGKSYSTNHPALRAPLHGRGIEI